MPKVLTIYCIGSGHDHKEEYNTLVQLWNTTNTSKYKLLLKRNETSKGYFSCQNFNDTTKKFEPLALGWESTAGNELKVLVDGVIGGVIFDSTAMKYINSSVKLLQLEVIDLYKPDVINIAGHSRGAITALVMPWFTNANYGNTGYNVFLIDPVKHASVPASKGLEVSPRVTGYMRIIMEDEANFEVIFPLETITVSKDSRFKIETTDNIRLPGTHGTASQFSPLTPKGDELKASTDNTKYWPIGQVAYTYIVDFFDQNGTTFISVPTDYELIDDYARILRYNPFEFIDGSYQRYVNDVDKCSPKQKQKYGPCKPVRDNSALNKICPNPFRWNKLFVNEQHKALFQTYFGPISNVLPLDLTGSNLNPQNMVRIIGNFNGAINTLNNEGFINFFESFKMLYFKCNTAYLGITTTFKIATGTVVEWTKKYKELTSKQ